MTEAQAKKEGVAAYRAGKSRAPALNQGFLTMACASGNTAAMMDAYMLGWTIANLANGMPSDFPSVRELAKIEAA